VTGHRFKDAEFLWMKQTTKVIGATVPCISCRNGDSEKDVRYYGGVLLVV